MSSRPRQRLHWLDLLRLLAILQILGFHWLRTCFETGRFGLTWSPAYQNVGIGIGQLHYLVIDHNGLSVSTLVNNAAGLAFGFGWEAVNVFILISGLGLALHYRPEKAGFSIPAWYAHRFRRILVPFYCVAFPMLLAGAMFKALASGHGGVLADLSAKISGKNLAEPLPVEFITHLFLFDPRHAHWAVNFFAPAWWFIPPLLVGYLCFPLFWWLIERFGVPRVLSCSLMVSMTGYLLTGLGLVVWNGWYYVIFHEAFNFALGIIVGRALARQPAATPSNSAHRGVPVEPTHGGAQTRFVYSNAAPALGLLLFALGNVANWYTPLFPISSAFLTPGFTLILAHIAARLARVPGAIALCRAIDPYYLYLLHQPFVLPTVLVSAALAAPAARAVGFSVGFVVYIAIAFGVVIAFQRLSGAIIKAWTERTATFMHRAQPEAHS